MIQARAVRVSFPFIDSWAELFSRPLSDSLSGRIAGSCPGQSSSEADIISIIPKPFICGRSFFFFAIATPPHPHNLMALWILRACFAVVAIGIGASLANYSQISGGTAILLLLLFVIAVIVTIGVDVFFKHKRIDLISSVYFGILIGLFLTYIVGLALEPLFDSYTSGYETSTLENRPSIPPDVMRWVITSLSGLIICYFCISVLWQTKDDFRFIIPYVEFSKEAKGVKPYILDTSVIIDGRIADIVETGVIDNPLIMPRFVLVELQSIADSSDKLRRARGRRGLDVMNRLRNNEDVDLKIFERELPEMDGESVDSKLLILAKHLDGKVVTGDFNLNKVAKLQNVKVINLNEIANSIKPVFLPGEVIGVKIVKAGEEAGQGIGYLDDGTMVVVEDGRGQIGSAVEITVTSMLQTSAGRMVFGKFQRA